IVFGVISAILRKKRILALTGMLFAAGATALGGCSGEINEKLQAGAAIGLGLVLFFLFFLGVLFVALEKILAQYPKQRTSNKDCTKDVVYFMSTHLPRKRGESTTVLRQTPG